MVVVGILGSLVTILIPVVGRALALGRQKVCMSNMHQIGLAIHNYASEYEDTIPFGPEPQTRTITNFYPTLGMPTSLISLESNGLPVGLGLMLRRHMGGDSRVLFCPDADQKKNVDAELAKVGKAQAQCDYYYRHGSGGDMLHSSGTDHIRLPSLGLNSNGLQIRALVMDQNYLCDKSLALYHVVPRTNHRQQNVNVLYYDTHVGSLDNSLGEYTVNVGASPYNSFSKIVKVFEAADRK